MPETEQQDRTLSELVVKEAVEKGLDSPMRESILEAVDEADGSRSPGSLPFVAAAFGLGAALGFLAGRESPSLEETSIADIDEPEIVEDVMEDDESTVEEVMPEESAESTESTDEPEESSSWLSRLVLAAVAIVGIVYLRRRFASDEEEWEPIEEFKPATDIADEEDEAAMDEDEEDESAMDDDTEDESETEDAGEDEDEADEE